MRTNPSPWTYIPSLYFLEGLPYIIINTVSVVLYADLGFPNDQIAFWTGWLYLPWTFLASRAGNASRSKKRFGPWESLGPHTAQRKRC